MPRATEGMAIAGGLQIILALLALAAAAYAYVDSLGPCSGWFCLHEEERVFSRVALGAALGAAILGGLLLSGRARSWGVAVSAVLAALLALLGVAVGLGMGSPFMLFAFLGAAAVFGLTAHLLLKERRQGLS